MIDCCCRNATKSRFIQLLFFKNSTWSLHKSPERSISSNWNQHPTERVQITSGKKKKHLHTHKNKAAFFPQKNKTCMLKKKIKGNSFRQKAQLWIRNLKISGKSPWLFPWKCVFFFSRFSHLLRPTSSSSTLHQTKLLTSLLCLKAVAVAAAAAVPEGGAFPTFAVEEPH